jgi:hypothetical protein
MGTAYGHEALGLAYTGGGRGDDAVRELTAALDQFRALGVQSQVAKVLSESGDARLAAGDEAGAALAWEESVAVFAGLELPEAGELRDKLRRLAARGAEAS